MKKLFAFLFLFAATSSFLLAQKQWIVNANCKGNSMDTLGYRRIDSSHRLIAEYRGDSVLTADTLLYSTAGKLQKKIHSVKHKKEVTVLSRTYADDPFAGWIDSVFNECSTLIKYSQIKVQDSAKHLLQSIYISQSGTMDTLENQLIKLDDSGKVMAITTTDAALRQSSTVRSDYTGDKLTSEEIWIMPYDGGVPKQVESRNYVYDIEGLLKAEVIFKGEEEICHLMILYKTDGQ
jgi:uncharacterized protein YuzE